MDTLRLIEIVLATAVASGTPILLAGLGELVAEKSGVLDLGIEGLMATGACAGFAAAHLSGNPWLGVGVAAIAGAALALVHALAAVLLRVDQVVSGLALVFVGTGLASLFGRGLVGQVAPTLTPAPLPLLGELPVLGPALFSHTPLVYLSIALVPLCWWLLQRTRPGLALRVCGEQPRLADASGVRVAGVRVAATCIGGALAGLGGAQLSLAETPSWVDGLVAGRGWIALAMVLFALWSPWRLLIGAWLFGGLVALQFRAQAFGLELNPYLLTMLPYLATIAVLAATVRARRRGARTRGAPAALGLPYARERRD